jgi:L-lactate dehydrogenase
MLRGLAGELVLYDRNQDRAEGQALDLNHGLPFAGPMRIAAGTLSDCAAADLVVLAAGVAQEPGESRMALLQRNAGVIRQLVEGLMAEGFGGMLLVATNPVDVLAYAAWRFSGLPPARVMGSGTILDSARLRYLLGNHCGVDPRNVHAYVLGEHGDTELPAWSMTHIAGMGIKGFCAACSRPCPELNLDDIFVQVRDAAQHIIARKGATYYAIALGLARITESIFHDQKSVLTVSALVREYAGVDQVYLGLPCVIGRAGVERVIRPTLNEAEAQRLCASARALREALAGVGLAPVVHTGAGEAHDRH